jgi:hypothetical protein
MCILEKTNPHSRRDEPQSFIHSSRRIINHIMEKCNDEFVRRYSNLASQSTLSLVKMGKLRRLCRKYLCNRYNLLGSTRRPIPNLCLQLIQRFRRPRLSSQQAIELVSPQKSAEFSVSIPWPPLHRAANVSP